MKSRLLFPLGALLLWAGPGRAIQILGTGVNAEEVAVLTGILTQSTNAAITVDKVLTTGQKALEAAQETSTFMRRASEVVVDFQYIVSNKDEIFNDATIGFGMAFPELQAIADDVERTRANLVGEHAGEPRSLIQLMNHARDAGGSGYQTMMAYDNLSEGTLKAYLEKAEKNAGFQASTTDVLNEAMTTDYNAVRAAVISARANALSAQAQREQADAALEQTRMMQQQYVTERRDRIADELAKREHANDLQAVVPADERVDGLQMIRDLKKDPSVDAVPVIERAR